MVVGRQVTHASAISHCHGCTCCRHSCACCARCGPHLQHDLLGVLVLQLSSDRRQLAVEDGHCTSWAGKTLASCLLRAAVTCLLQCAAAAHAPTCSPSALPATPAPHCCLTRLNGVADRPVVQRAVKGVHVVAINVEADLATRTHLRGAGHTRGMGKLCATATATAPRRTQACSTGQT